MLTSVLAAGPEFTVVQAAALVAGEWVTDGPHSERTGPYSRTVVSRAPTACPHDIAEVGAYARGAARAIARPAPAVRADVRVVLGGERDGATVAPMIVAEPPEDASVVTHEVFGALVAVLPFDDLDEVIERCNAGRYGLQAGLFTRDLDRIITAWRDLEVGGLVVNGSSNHRLDHVPFGGVKDSGFGRESPGCMIDDFIIKTMMLRGVSLWGGRG